MSILREFNLLSVLFRLLLAALAGGTVGYGRAKRQCNAGLRTYVLTCLGAALTMLISFYESELIYHGQWAFAAEYADLKFDGTRYPAQVINGIGFLAAGTILAADHQQVSGLTSAIGLFASACLGIAAGAGFYECVIVALVMIVFSMEVLKPIELRLKRRMRNITFFVEYQSENDIEEIKNLVLSQEATIFEIDTEQKHHHQENFPSAIISIRMSKEKSSHSELLSSVAELPCVLSIQELIS